MVLNKEKTDKILNSYEGMSPSSVWSAWNSVQKSHFLRDHFHTKGEVVPVNVYKLSFNELPESLKREISTHVYSGQYAKGGVVKGAKFKHDGKEYEIKKIQDGSIYTTDGKIYGLKALESFGVKFTKERAKSNKPRGIRGERRERMEYELEDLYRYSKIIMQDLRDLKRDMEEEAGEKGEKWTDEDANRYGEQMNFIEAQIESLEKQIAVKEEKLSYAKGGVIEQRIKKGIERAKISNDNSKKKWYILHSLDSYEYKFPFEINSLSDIQKHKEDYLKLGKEYLTVKKENVIGDSYEDIIAVNFLSSHSDITKLSKEDRVAAKKLLNDYMSKAIKEFKVKKKEFGFRGSVKKYYSFKDGGKVEDKVYIDFLNKEKGFKKDRKYFKSYEEARKWALKNFDKFDPDMIKTEMAKGGSIESYSTSDLMGMTGITKEEMDKFGMGREDLLSLAKEQGQTRKSNNWEYSIGGL